MKSFNILLTCAGGGLSAELRRRILLNKRFNIKIIAVDSNENNYAKLFTHYFEKVPIGISPKYIKKIVQIIKKYDIDLVIPCSDEEALSMAKNRVLIENSSCTLACSAYETLNILSDKLKTYKILKKNSIPVPFYTPIYNHEELLNKIELYIDKYKEMVIKPAVSRGGRNIIIINKNNYKKYTQNDFYIKKFIKLYPLILMERLIEPIYDIDLLSIKGKLIRGLARRRLDSNNPNNGHIIEENKSLYQLANKICSTFNLSWLYDCDIMMGENGLAYILEVNPRPSGSLAISYLSGMDYIEDMIAIIKKEKLNKVSTPENKIIVPYKSLI